jgi:threonine aldolase
LSEDHARARRIAEALAPLGVVDPAAVQTNLVMLDLSQHRLDAAELAEAAREQGVWASPMGAQAFRLITHLDLDDDGVDRAIEVLTALLK